jgi:hypothetical protein
MVGSNRYLGTISSPTAFQLTDSAQIRGVWNYYNRVERPVRFFTATASWTYATTGTWRQVNADSTNMVQAVLGVNEERMFLWATTNPAAQLNQAAQTGIGLDSTTANAATLTQEQAPAGATIGPAMALYNDYPGLGFHTFYWLEYIRALGTFSNITFYGPGANQSRTAGLSGLVRG